MTSQDIIDEVQKDASEWLEMAENPYALVSWILANKIIKLNDHIQFLEKRLNHVDTIGL